MGGMRCLVWSGELIDTERVGDTAGSDTLYIRTAGFDAGVLFISSHLSIIIYIDKLNLILALVICATLFMHRFFTAMALHSNKAKEQRCKDCASCSFVKWHSDTHSHRHFPCMVQVQRY